MMLKLIGNNPDRMILFVIVFAVILIVGCAPAKIKPEGMIPEPFVLSEQRSGSVIIHVDGGHTGHAMQLPEISNEDFLKALKAAVEQSSLFQTISDGENGDFEISAHIFNLSQAFFGRASVNLEIAWQLIRMNDGKTLWRESIRTYDDGFFPSGNAGSKSYDKTKAIERVARQNISLAIERMSKF